MHHRLYLHLVWTTRDRARLIDRDIARFLCRFLRAMARRERAYILEIGMVQTHVHVLMRLHPTASVSPVVQRLKGASSAIAAKEGLGSLGRLYWAKGYAVHSVSPRALESVRAYLRGQRHHHPSEAIAGWEGDQRAEYDAASGEAASKSASRRDGVPSSGLSRAGAGLRARLKSRLGRTWLRHVATRCPGCRASLRQRPPPSRRRAATGCRAAA